MYGFNHSKWIWGFQSLWEDGFCTFVGTKDSSSWVWGLLLQDVCSRCQCHVACALIPCAHGLPTLVQCCGQLVPCLPLSGNFTFLEDKDAVSLLFAFPIQVLVNVYRSKLKLKTCKSVWQEDRYWSNGTNLGSRCTHKFAGCIYWWEWWKPGIIFEKTNKNYCNGNYSTKNKNLLGSVYGWGRENNVCNIILQNASKGMLHII